MPLARAALALALAAGAQAVLTSYLPATARVFDFFLIVAVYYAMTTRQVAGMFGGLACGLIQDGLLAPLIGLNAFAKTLIAYLVGSIGKRVELTQPIPQFLILVGATLLQILTFATLHLVLGLTADLPSGGDLLAGTVGNSLMGTAIYAVLRRRRRKRPS